jgi:8-oxo-dGTP pyrophosphatase MutT (NUDIX family)
MEKFTNINYEQEEPEVVYEGDYKKIIKIDGWEVNKTTDSVICVPYFEDTMEFVMRREVIPPYKFVDGEEKHLVCVAGLIDENETAEEAVYRELYEETGIVVKTNYSRLKKWRMLFSNKGSIMRIHIYYIPLMHNEYDEHVAPTDGSTFEKLADNVKIHISHLKNLQPADAISSLCIEYLKDELLIR